MFNVAIDYAGHSGQTGHRTGKAERGRSGAQIRLRRRLQQRPSQLVAEDETHHLVALWRALLIFLGQGKASTCISITKRLLCSTPLKLWSALGSSPCSLLDVHMHSRYNGSMHVYIYQWNIRDHMECVSSDGAQDERCIRID